VMVVRFSGSSEAHSEAQRVERDRNSSLAHPTIALRPAITFYPGSYLALSLSGSYGTHS